MTRQYAQVASAIWMDPDFVALSTAAQRVYIVAISQPHITLAGVVPYTPSRWARFAPDTTAEDIAAAVDELVEARFVKVDPDTDELWVRSFTAHNGKNPKSQKGALSALGSVFSPSLRSAIQAELARLGIGARPPIPPPQSDQGSPIDTPSEPGSAVDNPGLSTDGRPIDTRGLLSPVSSLLSPASSPPNPPASGGEPDNPLDEPPLDDLDNLEPDPPPKRRTRSLARQAQHDARQAWTAEVAPAIARHGRNTRWRDVPWPRPEIVTAIEQAGGWTHLCNLDVTAAQQAFCAAWPTPTGAHT